MDENAVELQGIYKEFGNVTVLNNVSFALKRGEIHALVGGNGAGKSTLMKILDGVHKCSKGTMVVNGKKAVFDSPIDARKHGIRMIFQELSLVPTLSVIENIFLNNECTKGGILDKKEMAERAKSILGGIGVHIDLNRSVQEYQVGVCQLIEIAKALSSDASVLIMDEPTTALTAEETTILFGIMRRLKERGVSIIYISHRLKEVIDIADRITVLKDGEIVSTIERKDFAMKSIIDAIVGKKVGQILEYKKSEVQGERRIALSVRELGWEGNPGKISFDLYKGEVLGLVGLLGSGRTETMEVLFGIRKQRGARITLDGEELRLNGVKDAIKKGIVLIPEDRRRQGLVLMHTLLANVSLPNLKRVMKWCFVGKQKSRELSMDCIEEFNIKANRIETPMLDLSGGNQQKVVIGKWFKTEPRVLLMDEPTAGVDIGAKGEIIDIIRKFSKEGMSVIFNSSEIAEVLAISDRIIIIDKGEVKKELARDLLQREEDLQYELQN